MTGGFQGGYGTSGAGAPTPVRRSNSAGCLLWGIGGCGALVLAIFIAFWFVGKNFFNKLNIKDAITQMGTCTETLVDVNGGLNAYRHDHKGQSPANLRALVPKYFADQASFSCGSAEKPVTVEYIAPTKVEQPDDIVLKVKTTEMSIAGQTLRQYAAVLNDGNMVQVQYSPLPAAAGRGQPNGSPNEPDNKDSGKDSNSGAAGKSQ